MSHPQNQSQQHGSDRSSQDSTPEASSTPAPSEKPEPLASTPKPQNVEPLNFSEPDIDVVTFTQETDK
jgi:hypothetical protein